MKQWLPAIKSLAVWIGATVLAALSLPELPDTPPAPTRPYSTAIPNAVPAMATPTDVGETTQAPPRATHPIPAAKQLTQEVMPHPEQRAVVQQTETPPPQSPDVAQAPALQNPYQPARQGPQTSKLRVRVIDGRTQRPISGAEVVLIETEQRTRTGPDGFTPWMDAPIIRNPKYRPLVAELHGQLGVIVYKNGYRDSIHLGIRMHEGVRTEATVWMYKLGPGDTRVEPVLYQVPYHHIWLVELADRFRSKTQPGEGPERP